MMSRYEVVQYLGELKHVFLGVSLGFRHCLKNILDHVKVMGSSWELECRSDSCFETLLVNHLTRVATVKKDVVCVLNSLTSR